MQLALEELLRYTDEERSRWEEWFRENGGLRRENGDTFRTRLLAVGGSVDPLAAFRAVRGRDADPAPLLRRRGLVTTA